MPKPTEIHDPQFEVSRVLHDDEHFSVAYGRWEGGPSCLGMRWNGAEGRLGYPVGRHRQPKFLVLPESFSDAILRMLGEAGLPGTDSAAVGATLAERTSGEHTSAPQSPATIGPHETDRSLRIAKWHLDQLQLPSAPTIEAANLQAELAAAVTVFAAASVEARLNTFIASPLLFMNEVGPRRSLARLMTKFMRLTVPQKIKFLRDQVPALKENEVLKQIAALCDRRNRILHTSFEYTEVKALPDQPYVESLHSHLPPSAFVQRPSLTTHRAFRPALDQANEDYETACAFMQSMRGVHPFEPWPPAGFGA